MNAMARRHIENRDVPHNRVYATKTASPYRQTQPQLQTQGETRSRICRKFRSRLLFSSRLFPTVRMPWFNFGCAWLKSQKAEEKKLSRTPSLESLASTISSHEPISDVENELHEAYDMVPEAAIGIEFQNGTLLAEAASTRTSPKKAAELLTRVANEQLTIRSLQKALENAAGAVSEGISNKMNDAMEGKDAIEMLNTVVGTITTVPSFVSLSSVGKHIGQAVESISGSFSSSSSIYSKDGRTVDDISASSSDPSVPEETEDDSRQQYAWLMGMKVRKALQDQGIVPEWQTANLDRDGFQSVIDEALSRFYDQTCSEYSYYQLVDMCPFWVGVPARRVWRLVFDTRIFEIMDDLSEEEILLEAGFELPEQEGGLTVQVWACSSRGIKEDEWEYVE